ncbi:MULTISPECIES: SufE family protein [Pseudomonas]|uniref:Fe-S metabolism protein SufE n=1 Tax=Pseudomonas cichorii TaxID=36746 RepID=A0ABQ1DU09_PSECI|nr:MULTISPECIES: SufE family protein [Pseudomonas]AHF66393.1 Fe-S metabolism associated SufE [Pseudomonas cichorii JBC1]QVE18337.1 SufE family protein [Pseudomonas cichorii]SDO37528.1 Cysteine desulfuration protein SufE [Pseudomonas cichorii]GFM74718.1 Fe-S metabolism protein SufE [Pseudomonas cichorii]GFM94505.1 Fe-S metabolism protein SufE [Pseudomonas cichorii]
MTLTTGAQTALDTFSQLQGWEQRARLLMQWGDRLPALSDDEKSEEHLVQGCESKVWLLGAVSDGRWQFRAASDARLIRGLVALLLERVNGLSEQELLEVDLPDWFNQLGLSRQLSPSRSNGLNAVLQKMRQLAHA